MGETVVVKFESTDREAKSALSDLFLVTLRNLGWSVDQQHNDPAWLSIDTGLRFDSPEVFKKDIKKAGGQPSEPAFMNARGYEPLAEVLRDAYTQSAYGKGKKRHGNGKPFKQQPIMEIGRMVGVGGHTYQICKKAQEATGMVKRGDKSSAIAELYGVIVYAAAAVLLLRESMQEDQDKGIDPL